jgi:signal transduction histidine kinase
MVGLEQSKLFNSLAESELSLLRHAQQLREFKAGEIIFKEGDRGDGLYIVGEGQVQISALLSGTERGVLAKLGPGEFFGEMAVLDDEPRSATASAEGDVKLYFIPREKVLEMLENSPRLSVKLVREISSRMRDFNRQYVREVLQAERLALVGRFARSIVHDFKNPLNIISLAAEMSRMERLPPAARSASADRILKQVQRLTRMINELLDYTRGAQSGVLADVNFRQFIQQLVEEASPELCQKKKVVLYVENDPPDVEICVDPQRLSHVFYNLFHNAVDAIVGQGMITLRFKRAGSEIVTELEDSGKGIAPEVRPRLFEAFATFGKQQGTGLGLSICKRIIEDHQGWIRARNEPGHGAIFEFGLPLKHAAGQSKNPPEKE